MTCIIIIDYGVGNLLSVKKGFEKADVRVEISSAPAKIEDSDGIVLPGVGAFAEAKRNLSGLEDIIIREVEYGKALLGICLGLQLLFTRSYEGEVTEGLNLIEGEVIKLPSTVKLPHIGWNNIRIERPSILLENVPNNSYMYFVNSYIAKPEDLTSVTATTDYGVRFPSVFERKNIFATQFHPEKSGDKGLRILRNFVTAIRK
ncbi:MAG: imidazole glycerol phosphate synthase subunit HisH [Candidatus Bathyarchaeia archaeon]